MKRFASAATVAFATWIAIPIPGFADPPVRVSDPDLYAACSTAGQAGRNFPDTEVEPYVAVNPATLGTNHLNLVGVWQQDRWSNGGARGLVAAASFDGGSTWTESSLPFNHCAPGGLSFERASDPWVSIGPDGTVYTVSISFDATTPRNAVAAATSRTGGRTWENLAIIRFDGERGVFNDKESVTADPVRPGTAYLVWDRVQAALRNPDEDEDEDEPAGRIQPAWFSKTTDGGKTWSAARIIGDPEASTIGHQIVVDPRTGDLFDFFSLILRDPPQPASFHVAFMKSTDAGATWSDVEVIARMAVRGVVHPNNPAERVRTGDILPEAAVDPLTGQLYVVWQDSRFSGGQIPEVAIATSTDGGDNWIEPAQVNTPVGRPAFTPSVQVNAVGTVAVTYYDFRTLQPGNTATLPTDYWITFSSDGGSSFGGEQHVAGPFNMRAAPTARGFFVGDYEGLAAVGTGFSPFFVQTTCGDNSCSATLGGPNPTDVFAARF